jgi:hypothetical protein
LCGITRLTGRFTGEAFAERSAQNKSKIIMKFLTNSRGNPKRLFVPINQFEFRSFTMQVRQVVSRAPRGIFRISQRPSGKGSIAPAIPAIV